MPNPPDAIGLALRIIDDVRDETERELLQPGKKPLRLPTLEAAMDSAKLGSALLARIDALERKHLPEEIQLTLALARDHAHIWSVRADWYWTAFDPLSGMFNMYGPTAYCLGYCVASMAGELARAPLADAGDRFRYLAGIADLAAHVDAMTERTRGQAERGIFLPRLQAKAAIELLDRLIARQPAELQVDEARLQGQDAFRSEVDRNVADHLVVALTRCRNLFDTAYLGRAGDDVGMMHLPDGADIYAELAKMHTSTKLSPLDLHRIGLDAIAAIRAQMMVLNQADATATMCLTGTIWPRPDCFTWPRSIIMNLCRGTICTWLCKVTIWRFPRCAKQPIRRPLLKVGPSMRPHWRVRLGCILILPNASDVWSARPFWLAAWLSIPA